MGRQKAAVARLGMRRLIQYWRTCSTACAVSILLATLVGCGADGSLRRDPGISADSPSLGVHGVQRDRVGRTALAGRRNLPALTPTALRAALAATVRSVIANDGTVQMAVMADWWSRPLTLGTDLSKRMRLWSLSKPVVATALLRERERRGESTADLDLYLERALERSDNCAMRELTLDLQDATGGIDGARRAISQTAMLAGASVDLEPAQKDREGSVCLTSGEDDLTPTWAHRLALLVGTSTWTITDAVRFVRGLAIGAPDLVGRPSISATVLRLMRKPKMNSEEPLAGTFTVAPDWGAGDAFSNRCWHLAYKAGWGGAQAHIPWLGAQIGTVTLPDIGSVAFAVAVHPYEQPPDDDPGQTTVPKAIALVLTALRHALEDSGVCAQRHSQAVE
jgi:hypothetical protein